MTIRKNAIRSAAVLTLVLATPFAYAQTNEKDADAERLFTEAKSLMEQRKFAEACPKLETAYRKDQQQGTLLNLAYCHKEMGSAWVAWTEFREAESKASDKQRRDFALGKMKELEKGLTKLVIDPQTKYELTEVIVEDRRIYDAEKNTPFFAEPNNQRKAVFHAKGKKPAILLVSVGSPKDKMQHIQVPEMADEDPAPPPPPVEPVATAGASAAPPAMAETSSWSAQKTFAVVAGAAGLGGIAVGSIFGLKTMSGACADGPPPQGELCPTDSRNATSTDGTISTIGFIAGGALLAGAVVLWVTAPSGSKRGALASPTVSANIGPSWAGLRGTF